MPRPADLMPDPGDDHEWTIHAMNIHGAFLEAKCRDLVESADSWHLASYKYPVNWQGESSELDIRAETQQGLARMSLLVECKKNNPSLTEWVFLRKRRVYTATPSMVVHLRLRVDAAGRVGLDRTAMEAFPWQSVVADDGRETRSDYRNLKDKGTKTKTANNAIYDAAKQVSIRVSGHSG